MEWLYGALGNLSYIFLQLFLFFSRKKKVEEDYSYGKDNKNEEKSSQCEAAIVGKFL